MIMSHEEMLRVTELTRSGQLMEATKAIQKALGGGGSGLADDDIVDVPFRPVVERASVFLEQEFPWGEERYRYRLFVPGAPSGARVLRPVVVMLHGCKQDSGDFALGTAMNAIAEQHDCLVLYPEQLAKANSMRCWNWFEPGHQVRGAGEPGMIAALALHVAAAHGGDAHRIYIAGLSAGGAMAVVTASLYPETFAAVGIHSGLPAGAATDVVSAFAAMRKGTRGARTVQAADAPPVPTIVFHGTADKTVAPANAQSIVDDATAAWTRAGFALKKTISPAPPDPARQRAATRTLFTTPDNRVVMENWSIAAGPHAWSGGDARGSFTDPRGPHASQAMLAFFLQHRLSGRNPPD